MKMPHYLTASALLLLSCELAESQEINVPKLLESTCSRCHNPQKKKGGVDLSPLQTEKDVAKHRKLIRKVIEQIETQSMPPQSEPPLVEVDRAAVVKWAKQAIVLSEPKDAALRNPGPAPLRRPNRYEYNRTSP